MIVRGAKAMVALRPLIGKRVEKIEARGSTVYITAAGFGGRVTVSLDLGGIEEKD